MSDENVTPVVEPTADPVAEPITPDSGEHMIPKSRFDEKNARVKELEDIVAANAAQQKRAEEERLKNNEDYKTLSENQATEIAELTPKADVAAAQEPVLQDILKAQIEKLPEDMRDVVPEGTTLEQITWLTKHESKFTKPTGPNIGAGEHGGSGEKSVVLSAEQKAEAAKMSLTEKEYAKGIKK